MLVNGMHDHHRRSSFIKSKSSERGWEGEEEGMARNGSGKEKAESVHLNSLLLSPYFLPPSSYTVQYLIQCSTPYTVDTKPEALDPTHFALQSIPHPCTLKTSFKAPPPLRHCTSFSPFASLAPSEHSHSSPCSRSTPPPAQPPVPPLALCLFCSSPATSSSATEATTTNTRRSPALPPAITCLCLCLSQSVCS